MNIGWPGVRARAEIRIAGARDGEAIRKRVKLYIVSADHAACDSQFFNVIQIVFRLRMDRDRSVAIRSEDDEHVQSPLAETLFGTSRE